MIFLTAILCFLVAGGIFSSLIWHGRNRHHHPLVLYGYVVMGLGWVILYFGR